MKAVPLCLLVLSVLYLLSPGSMEYIFSCPAPEDVVTTAADSFQCTSNDECSSDTDTSLLCCPTSGCGQQCTPPLRFPYHPPVLECPGVEDGMVGTCEEDCEHCSSDQLCCSNGCGHRCTAGLPVTPVCQAIEESRRNGSSPHLIGEYVLQCEEDGRFSAVQCHGSMGMCWCVDPETGMPQGGRMIRGQPNCDVCTYNGKEYNFGQEFSDDGKICTCNSDLTVTCTCTEFYSCPPLSSDVVGICSEECSSHSDCTDNQRCCSNGCGHTCSNPVRIPYVSPSLQCPEEYERDKICDIQACSDSTECGNSSQLCCTNPCGSNICVAGIPAPFPCSFMVSTMTESLPGRFVPSCNGNGQFRALQCFSEYCWCVNTANGQPTSELRLSTNMEDLACGNCEYEGGVYNHGSVVEYYEGCAKSTCLGGEIFRTEDCDICEYDGKVYEHGERLDDDCSCSCSDGYIACANGISCEPEPPTVVGNLLWWHVIFIANGVGIGVLAIIAVVLLVVVMVIRRKNQNRHKILRDTALNPFESETAVSFKSGLPANGAESLEMKVPLKEKEVYETELTVPLSDKESL